MSGQVEVALGLPGPSPRPVGDIELLEDDDRLLAVRSPQEYEAGTPRQGVGASRRGCRRVVA
jgi:hypothetical protein